MIKSAPPVVLAFLLGAAFSLGAAEATSASRQLDRLVAEVHEDISDLRVVASSVGNSQLRRQLYREVSELEGSVNDLDATFDRIYAPAVPAACSPQEFSRIYSAVSAESFGDEQLSVLRAASQGRRFSSAQVASLMNLFDFSDDRIDAAVLLYPQVTDPQNWYTVYGTLTFSSDKTELRQRTR